jgi:hypothetical protein
MARHRYYKMLDALGIDREHTRLSGTEQTIIDTLDQAIERVPRSQAR